MSIFLAILALSVLIIIHELGHFTAAKLTGIRVLEFALFMGPRLYSKKIGETEYSIRSIPIGGFVRMEGEEEASEDEAAYSKKPKLVRAAVLAAGPVANILIAFILMLIISITNGYMTTKVGPLDLSSPAYQAGLREGDKIVSFNNQKVFHPTDIGMFIFGTKGAPAAVGYLRGSDPVVRPATIIPEVIQKNRFMLGYSPKASAGEGWNVVDSVVEGAPAKNEGLMAGDKIIELNGNPVNNARDIREFLKVNGGKPVTLTVVRNDKKQRLTITPLQDVNEEQYDPGITFQGERGNFFSAAANSFNYICSMSRIVYYSIAWLITGRLSLNNLSGPIGIVSAVGSSVKHSETFNDLLLALFGWMSLISINLGLFNLIPFPALDGSKLLLLGVEAVRRKALPPEREAFISLIGFVLLMALMVFTVYNDVAKLITGGF